MAWPKFPAIACIVAGVLAGAAPGVAQAQDGSASNNPDIFRDGYKVDWVPSDAVIPGENPGSSDGLPFQIDWSVSLRGSYQQDNGGQHFRALVVPEASLVRSFSRGQLALGTGAELEKLDGDSVRLSALRASIVGDYQLDSLTSASGSLRLSRAQESLLNAAVDVAGTPLVTSGEAEGSVVRQMGKLSLTLRGGFSRTVYEPTTLVGGLLRDNAYRNNTSLDAGLRAGWELTPILTIFADTDLRRSVFDAPSPSVGAKTDNYDASVRVGVSGKWQDRLEAEVSGGMGFVRYDDGSLGDARTALYDASVTYRPDETTSVRGTFSTEFVPPTQAVATTRVSYAAGLEGLYRVNAWLALRASAAWSQVRADDGSGDTSYGFGGGADYTLNRHTALTADYAYAHTEDTPDPARDAHRVTLGVTFKR